MYLSTPKDIQNPVRDLLEKKTSSPVELISFSPVEGGCINDGGQLKTSVGCFFLKWNSAEKFPSMFEAEAKGLKLLASPKVIDIPQVIDFSEAGGYQFLILEFIESSSKSKNYWEMLGQQLASLHKIHNPTFGLDYHNFIGSLHQFNNPKGSWVEFFIDFRLRVQLALAIDSQLIQPSVAEKFEVLFKTLPSLLPEEKPSLLHGDLWTGNLITNEKGEPCLIDPAVYYGHREVELAYIKLFSEFDVSFYEAYQDVLPLSPGFEQRVDLYNLYPLLVHVNLFGAAYTRPVLSILKGFT